MYRFTVSFLDNTTFLLFGEAYFADKMIFFRAHQSNLKAFKEVVRAKGRPIKMYDNEDKKETFFDCPAAFDAWYRANQANDIDF